MSYLDFIPVELFDIISINIDDITDLKNFSEIYTINYERLFIVRYGIKKPIKFLYGIKDYNWERLYHQILTDVKGNGVDLLDIYYNGLKYKGKKMKLIKGYNPKYINKRYILRGVVPAFLFIINE